MLELAIEESLKWFATNTVKPTDEIGTKKLHDEIRQTVYHCLCCNHIAPHGADFDVEFSFHQGAGEYREIIEINVLLSTEIRRLYQDRTWIG